MESMSRSLVNSVAYLMSRSLLVPLSMLFMLSAVSASAQKAEEQALFRLEDAFANAVVTRAQGSAHGTTSTRTPQRGQSTRRGR